MQRSQAMQQFVDSLSSQLFGSSLSDALEGKTCVICGKSVLRWSSVDPVGPDWDFRDDLSLREYRISGMCQACQDDTFRSCDEDVDPDEREE